MKITRTDYLRIVDPKLRDPGTEARRLALIESSERLGTFTPEALARGIPVQPEKIKRPVR